MGYQNKIPVFACKGRICYCNRFVVCDLPLLIIIKYLNNQRGDNQTQKCTIKDQRGDNKTQKCTIKNQRGDNNK